MHTVCRFCHYLSQVDRYAQFASAYCCNWRYLSHSTKKKKINYCIWRIKSACVGVLYIFLQKLAKKGNILLEQTAQALIRLHRYLGMLSQLTVLFPWCCSAETRVMSPEPQHKNRYLPKRMKLLHRCLRAVWSTALFLSTFKEGTFTLANSTGSE